MTIALPAPASEQHLPAVPIKPAPISRRAWQVLGVAASGLFVVFLDATIVNIAFPAMRADFASTSLAAMSWVLNAYAVVFGALLVTAGRLADDRGRRRVFLAGLGVFAVASALCGLAPTVELLVAARVLQAVGAALVVPASLALLLPEFPAGKRATAVGLWGAVGAVASATGPSLGAVLVEGPGWRWIFYINVPICAVAYWLARRVLHESKGERRITGADPVGVALVSGAFGLLSLGLVQGEQWGWASERTVGVLGAAVALLGALVVQANRHPDPVMPVRLFRVPSFSIASLATMIFSAAFFANLLCNVLFLTGVWQYSVLRAALAVLPGPLLAAAASPLAGALADRYGYRVVLVPGCIIFTAGQAWLVLQVGSEPDYAASMLPGMALVGIAIGLVLPTLGAAGVHALPPAQFALGSAVISTARQLGSVMGVSALVAVLGGEVALPVLTDFHDAWTMIALATTTCAVVCWGVRPLAAPADA